MYGKMDLNLISKTVVTLIMAAMVGYVFAGMDGMKAGDAAAQAEKMEQLLDKALLQCYALEGSYPSDAQFEAKMLQYGVILNQERYYFYYSAFASNIKPDVMVIPK